ncbi:hypothetical protein ACFL6I_23360, partial [candidate division KSB1 bacterium]
KMFVHIDGRISYFCRMKCEKNMIKLKRNPVKITWTKRYQDLKKGSKSSGKTPVKEEKKETKKEQKKK